MVAASRGALALLSCFALIVSLHGCSDENPNEPPGVSPQRPRGAGPGGGPAVASNPQLKVIMEKVGKGPEALQKSLGGALKQAEPDWGTIQPKTKEYSGLAAEIGKHDPPRGDNESWKKLTLAFADSASELDKAAQAKEKDQAVAALDSLGSSCMGCHRQHRPGPGGPGGMGGPPGGFRRPGGPGGFPPPPGRGPPPPAPGAPAPQ
jgi:hypothetical protein